MYAEELIHILGADFFVGVPDSQLKSLCTYLTRTYGIDAKHHIIGANEGNCVALAAGYHLATGKVPVVYMQNSGEGNAINPIASLLNDKVYGIPVIFIIGWRGEPGTKDEPQHIYQGEVTLQLLQDMDIRSYVLGKETTTEELQACMEDFKKDLSKGKSVAFVVQKDALPDEGKIAYGNEFQMVREEVIQHVAEVAGDAPIVSTTGKASRELFEVRERNEQGHKCDFLTVGSMGHSSSIALGIAVNKRDTKVWCIDGDGALLMHMGAMATIGSVQPQNLVHVVINNVAHESVGGMPTVADRINIVEIAKACGYTNAKSVDNYEDLVVELRAAKERLGLSLIEAKCSLKSRADLGRPTIPAIENKENFMNWLKDFA